MSDERMAKRGAKTLTCMMEAGKGRLLLTARRKQDNAVIHFGNVSDEQGKVFLGTLSPQEVE